MEHRFLQRYIFCFSRKKKNKHEIQNEIHRNLSNRAIRSEKK